MGADTADPGGTIQDARTENVLVTGATGFVGSRLVPALAHDGWCVRSVVRRRREHEPATGVELVEMNDIGPTSDWRAVLGRTSCVVHLASPVQARHSSASWAAECERIIVGGTVRLATEAAEQGVSRFIFVSSIKVNGARTFEAPFSHRDPPRPAGPYAEAKLAAEEALREICDRTGLELAVIRPPLVYGPGVQGNFLRLMTWIWSGLPLPFGAVRNRRSLLSVWNLVDFIRHLTRCDRLPSVPWLVADGTDLSTPELVGDLAVAMRRPAHLIAVPVSWLTWAGRVAGVDEALGRLTGSLQVDSSASSQLLGWVPPVGTRAGLTRTAEWFVGTRGRNA